MLAVDIEERRLQVDHLAVAEIRFVVGIGPRQVGEAAPPFGDLDRCAEGQCKIVLFRQVEPGDITRLVARGVGNARDQVSGAAIAEGRIVAIIEGMGQLEIVGVLRIQEGVAFLEGQFVQLVLKRVQVLVARAVDAAAVGKLKAVLGVELVGKSAGGEEVQVSPFDLFVIGELEGLQHAFRVGLIGPQPDQEVQFG